MDAAEEKLKQDLYEKAMIENLTPEQRGEIKAFDRVISSLNEAMTNEGYNMLPSRRKNAARRQAISNVQSMRARVIRTGMGIR
jgi:hypothetical protein